MVVTNLPGLPSKLSNVAILAWRWALSVGALLCSLILVHESMGMRLLPCASSCGGATAISLGWLLAPVAFLLSAAMIATDLVKDRRYFTASVWVTFATSLLLISLMIHEGAYCPWCASLWLFSAAQVLLLYRSWWPILPAAFVTYVGLANAFGRSIELSHNGQSPHFAYRPWDQHVYKTDPGLVIFEDPQSPRCRDLEDKLEKQGVDVEVYRRWYLQPQTHDASFDAEVAMESAFEEEPQHANAFVSAVYHAPLPLTRNSVVKAAALCEIPKKEVSRWLMHPASDVLLRIKADADLAASLYISAVPAICAAFNMMGQPAGQGPLIETSKDIWAVTGRSHPKTLVLVKAFQE